MICRHCHERRANRPRGLCWTCYYTPGMREHYPSESKFAVRGVGHGTGNRTLPEPTAAPPHSEAKIVVLVERAQRGEALFSPLDAKGHDACCGSSQ